MKKVLFVSESPSLPTGFGTYTKEVLERLAKTNLEIGLLSCYGVHGDPSNLDLPYRVFDNTPETGNQSEIARYTSDHRNEFGAWKFEETLLKFKPDVVCTFRDNWNDEFVMNSPLREYFRWVHMACVDATPQQPEWLDMFATADALLAYTDWAGEVIEKQSGGTVKYTAAAPPGVDFDIFKPHPNKDGLKQSMGLGDKLVVGMVCRNQVRKLLPEMMHSFSMLPKPMASKSLLYLHTGYPDAAWDIPLLLKEYGLCSRTLFSYFCDGCGGCYPDFYSGPKTACRHCGGVASMASSSKGFSREALAGVYNLFDVFVLLSTNEGYGMPLVEAAGCGVPIISTDYTAPSEIVRQACGVPCPVKHFRTEPETHRKLAIPDTSALTSILEDVLAKPTPVRQHMGFMGREMVKGRYNYDNSANVWAETILAQTPAKPWNSPVRTYNPPTQIPPGLDNHTFVRWCLGRVMGRDDLLGSFHELSLVGALSTGFIKQGTRAVSINRDSIFNDCYMKAELANKWELARQKFC